VTIAALDGDVAYNVGTGGRAVRAIAVAARRVEMSFHPIAS
jgi:hypothetical protein